MSKVFKSHHNQDFQATMNQYFNSVLLDFDNVKEINAIMIAFEKKESHSKPKQRKNK
jgi:hypothetical protein